MKINFMQMFLILAVLFVLACNFSQPVPTNVAVQPIVTIEIPTNAVVEIPTPIAKYVLTIPQGLAAGTIIFAIPASLEPDSPVWDIHPTYDEVFLDGYILQNTFHQPKIYIYPAAEYAKVNEGAAEIIGRLQALLADQNAPMPQNMPFMPLFNAGQVFHSNEQFLTFQNGIGVRFLTQFAQVPYPANNHDLFYTFQGLTNDGVYYISAILPINTAFLPPDGNPETPLPADGVPFDWNNFENTGAHFELVKQKLNATDPNAFTPSLTNLDALIQSISVTSQ